MLAKGIQILIGVKEVDFYNMERNWKITKKCDSILVANANSIIPVGISFHRFFKGCIAMMKQMLYATFHRSVCRLSICFWKQKIHRETNHSAFEQEKC